MPCSSRPGALISYIQCHKIESGTESALPFHTFGDHDLRAILGMSNRVILSCCDVMIAFVLLNGNPQSKYRNTTLFNKSIAGGILVACISDLFWLVVPPDQVGLSGKFMSFPYKSLRPPKLSLLHTRLTTNFSCKHCPSSTAFISCKYLSRQ